MKEQLQQIQAVAVVTFLCILISVNSTGDYGKWFVIDGARETVDPVTGNATQYNTCLLYTSPSPRDKTVSRMPSSA